MNILSKLFKKKKCTLCAVIPESINIHSLNHFKEIVKEAKSWVSTGILTQSNKGLAQNFSLLESISDEPPWDDIVYTKLQCKECGKKFELFADTYHGGKNNRWCKT